MSLRAHTTRLVDEVNGAHACVVMGFDGGVLDACEKESMPVDLKVIITECAAAMAWLRHANSQKEGTGDMTDLTINMQALTIVLRPLDEAFFLAVALAPQALVGKARLLMRLCAHHVAEALH